ncbi:ABC transporter permease [Microbacterium sp. NIBRBAC000506063]|uniref:ABC transporter permease n=1 Tax=Microbacterium sp. NIBRBAC000506063 TaxID=2734618 RepID=UPI001BB70051|nr:ABC transporter permease [Microbacterium sp. NIBRBAC000506063]QTV79284.1 ABC transporter permease [Microbacterium sp. NIBRBAC000506063]
MIRSVPILGKILAILLGVVVTLYMLVPLLVVAGASVSESRFLTFPPQGFTLDWYVDALTSDTYLEPFRLSLMVGVTVAIFAAVIGTAAALALTRFPIPGAGAIQALLMSPLTLPTIILAIGALSLTSMTIGAPNVGVLVVVHIVIAIPYVMRTVTGVMARADHFTEEAARTLGASAWNRYRLVVLPIARPGIAAGAFFAFNISFDDAVIALFLRTPQLETLPIAIYGQLEFSTSPTVAAVSTLMVLITVVLMIVLERIIGLGRLFV